MFVKQAHTKTNEITVFMFLGIHVFILFHYIEQIYKAWLNPTEFGQTNPILGNTNTQNKGDLYNNQMPGQKDFFNLPNFNWQSDLSPDEIANLYDEGATPMQHNEL